jgi:Spy/CpxP family protein refolding chaperone
MLFAIFLLIAVSGLAQTTNVQAKPLTDDDIKMLREDIQAVKDDIIKNTMQFSDSESQAFWPVYKEYAKEQHAIADDRLSLIHDYARNLDSMDDAKASSLTQRMFNIDDQTQSLRKKYFPKFEKALGAKRAAKFYQVDNRVTMMMNVQLATEVPLIP